MSNLDAKQKIVLDNDEKNNQLTRAIETTIAKAFNAATNKAAYCIWPGSFYEVKSAKDDHGNSFKETAKYKNFLASVFEEEVGKDRREHGHWNRVWRENEAKSLRWHTFPDCFSRVERSNGRVSRISEQVHETEED